METKMEDLTGKLKALDLVLAKSKDTVTTRKKDALKRSERSIARITSALYVLKEEIEELKFINKDSEENVRTWADEVELKLTAAESALNAIRDVLSEIEQEEISVQREKNEEIQRIAVDAETKKQLSIEQANLELERAHKEAERKRDLEHGELLRKQTMEYQKTVQASMDTKSKQVQNIKLPK